MGIAASYTMHLYCDCRSVRMANISRQILVSISVRHGLAVQKRHVKMGGE